MILDVRGLDSWLMPKISLRDSKRAIALALKRLGLCPQYLSNRKLSRQ